MGNNTNQNTIISKYKLWIKHRGNIDMTIKTQFFEEFRLGELQHNVNTFLKQLKLHRFAPQITYNQSTVRMAGYDDDLDVNEVLYSALVVYDDNKEREDGA